MLNDAKIKAAKPREKPYKLADSGQLYLLVNPGGGRLWRMNYTFGKNAKGNPAQKTLTLGAYPAITLVEARAARDKAKAVLQAGLDPAVERRIEAREKIAATENTFEVVARQWHEFKKPTWSAVHAKDVLDSLENDVFPHLGKFPIASIKTPRVLEVLRLVETRGAIETAHRLRQRVSSIFVYGIAAGVATNDPAASIGGALKPVPKSKKQPSITDGKRVLEDQIKAIRQVIIDCEAERCRIVTKLALRFIAITIVRPGELRYGHWSEFQDLGGKEPLWDIAPSRMKGDLERKEEEDGDHLVPLPTQAIELLEVLRTVTGHLPLCFPGERHLHKPISENTLRALLIRAGYYQRHVPHGFRAAFSTIMNERARIQGNAGDREIIDLMLAHVPTGTSGSETAYNRAAYMPRRRQLAQEWADLLLEGMPHPAEFLGQPIRYAATGPGKLAT